MNSCHLNKDQEKLVFENREVKVIYNPIDTVIVINSKSIERNAMSFKKYFDSKGRFKKVEFYYLDSLFYMRSFDLLGYLNDYYDSNIIIDTTLLMNPEKVFYNLHNDTLEAGYYFPNYPVEKISISYGNGEKLYSDVNAVNNTFSFGAIVPQEKQKIYFSFMVGSDRVHSYFIF
jgi:hypothetical protein